MRILRLAALLSVAALAARAECSAEFDGVWGWEAAVQGQCTVMTFANDSRKKQTGSGTWTNLGDDCSYRTPNMILEAEYDNLRHGNLTARMIDASTCELTFGKAHVSVDTYGVWAPLSKTAWLQKSGKRSVSFCFENSGHQLGQCTELAYSSAWN